MSSIDRLGAIVLAGSRGPDDPVARAGGLQHKAFVPVAGVPMLQRVLDTLAQVPRIGRVVVVGVPQLPPNAGPLTTLLEAAPTPSLSVLRGLDALSNAYPILVTTADHPLLTAAMIEHFVAASPPHADAAVALAPAQVVQAAYPETQRTYLRFRRAAYSGCNLFLLRTARSRAFVEFWRLIEQDRKRPLRMFARVGAGTVLRYALGLLTLEETMARLSARVGAHADAVEMPFAEAAIDVDKPADLALAEEILRRRTAG